MEKKHIKADIGFAGCDVIVRFKLGNWAFLQVMFDPTSRVFNCMASFTRPKYAGGYGSPEARYTSVDSMPTLINVWGIYTGMKKSFEDSYAHLRVDYYQAKLTEAINKLPEPVPVLLDDELPPWEDLAIAS